VVREAEGLPPLELDPNNPEDVLELQEEWRRQNAAASGMSRLEFIRKIGKGKNKMAERPKDERMIAEGNLLERILRVLSGNVSPDVKLGMSTNVDKEKADLQSKAYGKAYDTGNTLQGNAPGIYGPLMAIAQLVSAEQAGQVGETPVSILQNFAAENKGFAGAGPSSIPPQGAAGNFDREALMDLLREMAVKSGTA
jgi:hypothetical protein